MGAVFWLAPWFALRLQGQGRVIFWTVMVVKGLPYMAALAWSLAFRPMLNQPNLAGRPPGSLWLLRLVVYLGPQIAILLYYLWLIGRTRAQLTHSPGTELLDWSDRLRSGRLRFAGFIRRARSWKAT